MYATYKQKANLKFLSFQPNEKKDGLISYLLSQGMELFDNNEYFLDCKLGINFEVRFAEYCYTITALYYDIKERSFNSFLVDKQNNFFSRSLVCYYSEMSLLEHKKFLDRVFEELIDKAQR